MPSSNGGQAKSFRAASVKRIGLGLDYPPAVIPAKAGTHRSASAGVVLGPCSRRDDIAGEVIAVVHLKHRRHGNAEAVLN
jgi:hypothetical protein